MTFTHGSLVLAAGRSSSVIDAIGWWGAVAMIGTAIVYGMTLLVFSYRAPRSRRRAHEAALRMIDGLENADQMGYPTIVVLVPCLNEATVIEASIRRLLAIPTRQLDILVIDDASNDGTAAVLDSIQDPRVNVIHRVPPFAQRGKGDALNDALRHVRRRYRDLPAEGVVVGVMDADGRLDPEGITTARLAFLDPKVGAVQLGVRINNRFHSALARMQDMEFVIFTEIFQKGRRHLGSVGMGGNGQFVRLSALNSLGERPWSDTLTEDFDLGIRLNASGWTNEFSAEAVVHQQGVTSLRRLLRQRARWFQGNLQASRLIRYTVREQHGRSRTDSLYQMLSPYLVLATSLLTASFVVALVAVALAGSDGTERSWMWLVLAYVLAFGPAVIYGIRYWRIERRNGFGFVRGFLYSHLYVLYSMLGYIAGWWAIVRTVFGRTGWQKTKRESESREAIVGTGAEIAELKVKPA